MNRDNISYCNCSQCEEPEEKDDELDSNKFDDNYHENPNVCPDCGNPYNQCYCE